MGEKPHRGAPNKAGTLPLRCSLRGAWLIAALAFLDVPHWLDAQLTDPQADSQCSRRQRCCQPPGGPHNELRTVRPSNLAA